MKKIAVNLILLFLTCLVVLFLFELSFRVFLFGTDSFSFNKMNSICSIGVSGMIKSSPFPGILYELKPRLDTYFKRTRFKTNSAGLRDKEYPLDKSPKTFRVAVIGDSFTMGAGIELEETYHKLIEKKLNDTQTETTYEFINFGVGGYSLNQYLEVLRHKAAKYKPDLILIGFCPKNDFYDPHSNKVYKEKEKGYPFFESFLWNKLVQIFPDPEEQGWRQDILDRLKGKYDEMEKGYMRRCFSEMGDFSRKHGIPIVVANLEVEPTELEFLEYITTGNGLLFINTSSSFRWENRGDYYISSLDDHPNAEANKIFAERIYDYLNRAKLL
jgi:hypothetical protein